MFDFDYTTVLVILLCVSSASIFGLIAALATYRRCLNRANDNLEISKNKIQELISMCNALKESGNENLSERLEASNAIAANINELNELFMQTHFKQQRLKLLMLRNKAIVLYNSLATLDSIVYIKLEESVINHRLRGVKYDVTFLGMAHDECAHDDTFALPV